MTRWSVFDLMELVGAALLEHILAWSCPPREDAVVLDPFAGSGSTAEAALNRRHRAVSIELLREHGELYRARMERRAQRATGGRW